MHGSSSSYSCLHLKLAPQPVGGRQGDKEEMDPAGRDGFNFGSCTRCGSEVSGPGGACRAMGRLFHDTCFICCVCGKTLVGKPFYSVSGGIYCEEDFLYSGAYPFPEVCDSCGLLIRDLILQARGKSYHPSCFRCVACSRGLEGLPFAVDSQSRVYCVSDYHRVRAPWCDACRTQILPTEGSSESVRVESLNKNYHVSCFKRNLMRTGGGSFPSL